MQPGYLAKSLKIVVQFKRNSTIPSFLDYSGINENIRNMSREEDERGRGSKRGRRRTRKRCTGKNISILALGVSE